MCSIAPQVWLKPILNQNPSLLLHAWGLGGITVLWCCLLRQIVFRLFRKEIRLSATLSGSRHHNISEIGARATYSLSFVCCLFFCMGRLYGRASHAYHVVLILCTATSLAQETTSRFNLFKLDRRFDRLSRIALPILRQTSVSAGGLLNIESSNVAAAHPHEPPFTTFFCMQSSTVKRWTRFRDELTLVRILIRQRQYFWAEDFPTDAKACYSQCDRDATAFLLDLSFDELHINRICNPIHGVAIPLSLFMAKAVRST